ncbi:MAG: shikimate kinase, partial [Syntrophomonadaceae bacterium]|nr:shikimate kinase [Syntrophomonadaceae bacterium]
MRMESGKNLILVGFMGSGKSATGLRLAQKIKWDFVDMDREIERITHMSVAELFRRYGEVRFRSEEKLLVGKLCARERLVIATGGGVLAQEENLRLLQQCGTLIYLEASPQEIFKRVSRKKNTRPLLRKGFSVEDIARLL